MATILIAEARFYPHLNDMLLEGARAAIEAVGHKHETLTVPGAPATMHGDPIRLRRVPVRRTDPPAFFRAKLGGRLAQERAYAAVVGLGKKAGAHA